MKSLRKNIDIYVEDKEITITDIANKAGITFNVLSNLLYKNYKDVELGKVIAISKALNISIDELVGAGTMRSEIKDAVRMCRELPEQSLYLIQYFIRHQYDIYSNVEDKDNYISVLIPRFENGIMSTTNVVEPMHIENFPKELKSRIYLGLKIPSDYYMPYYHLGEIVLISADRLAQKGERCVITSNGSIHIVEKMYGDNKYRSIIGKQSFFPSEEISDKIGYVVGFLNVDGTWGIR